MNGYVQTRCPRCGNAAWGHPMQAVPCNSCGQAVPPMAQPQGWGQAPGMGSFGAAPGMPAAQPQPQHAQQAWGAPPPVAGQGAPPPGMGGAPGMPYGTPQPGFGAPPAGAQPQGHAGPQVSVPLPFGLKVPVNLGGGGAKLKIIGGVVLAIVLAVGGVIVKSKMTPKGMLSYGTLGLDKGKPDADKMYTAVAASAKKWRKDAVFWSLNYQAVRADGTVDVSKGAEVVYTSPSASASHAKKVRSDSIKKFGFNTSGVSWKSKWGWNDPLEDLEAHPEPKCTIKDVVALLGKQGLTGSKTVRITFDPKFADYYAWRVIGSDPKMDALFSWDDCSPIK